MDFSLSDEQRMLCDGAQRYARDTGSLELIRSQKASTELNQKAWKQFAELGWLALPLPEDAGGLSGSSTDVMLLMLELGRCLAAEPIITTVILCGHILNTCDSGTLRDTLLPQIASGDLLVALADDEPSSRYNLFQQRQTTTKQDGAAVLLSGDKIMALNVPSSTKIIVSATTDQGALTLWLVDKNAEGIAVSNYKLIDGSDAADIEFRDVRLTPDAQIAGPATAPGILEAAVDHATLAVLAQAVGSMETCLEICRDYVKTRKQFGQTIGSFQALQHILAEMFVATHQSRSILYQLVASIDGPADIRSKAVSMAKMVIGESGLMVGRQGIQLHGGYGVTDEYLISHHYRKLLVAEKLFGDITFHSERRARPAIR